MKNYLDNYINGENLTQDQLECIHLDQLLMFAYRIKDCKDYKLIKDRLIGLQLNYEEEEIFIEDVFYILNCTGLTRWQKFKLKFRYMFL